jgi:hypothetical protein
MVYHSIAYARNVSGTLFAMPTPSLAPDYVLVGVVILAEIHVKYLSVLCVTVIK